VSFAEARAVLGVLGALNRMRVGDPLRNAAARAWQNADEDADRRAAHDQPEMAKRVLDSLDDAGLQILRLPVACDRRAAHREIDNLGNREYADEHRHEIEAVPQVHETQVEAKRAGLSLLAYRGKQQAEEAHRESADLAAHAEAAERSDTGDPDHGEHEELGRAKRKNQRANDGDRERQDQGADQRADEGTHQRRAESASGLSLLRHR